MSEDNSLVKGTALAGAAIAVATIEALFDKGILSLQESRAILDHAMRALGPSMQTPEGYAASQIIAGFLRGKFSARQQDK
ncbi:hypothetical protein [Methylosinus sporium]|uniref:hypothetical protein n=1 Tax=Methylosinus sporium TaxID=428 RepID=UPI00383A6157